MIDTKTIKDRILSFAFQGRLVKVKPSNISNDNLEAIHSQVKGYIPVSEEEYLINAPKEWSWTRLGYITCNHGQKTPSDTFSYIDVGTLDNVKHRLSSTENIVEAKDAPSRAKKVVVKGDVIYSTVRPYLHNICIIDKDFSYTPIASTAFCVMQANEAVLNNRYLFYWLLTKEFDKYSNGDPSKGALYPAIGEKDLLRGTIPLPSIAEQEEIVEKIESVFEILDKIDALQEQYASNQEALKSKLIDAAIQGKVTEQLPEDGTAEELYKLIGEKKKNLIKDGKLKKAKALPAIKIEDLPFEIPSNWGWYRLGDIGITVTGSTPPKSHSEYYGGDYPFFKPADLDRGKHITSASEYLTDAGKDVSRQLEKGTVLVCCIGSIGKCAIIDEEGTANQQINALTPINCSSEYLLYVISSQYFKKQLNEGARATTVSIINKAKFDNCIIPLPPQVEQERIVCRLNEILNNISE